MKKYGTIKPTLQLAIKTKAGVRVYFEGGQSAPTYRPATFSTNKRGLQKELESHPWFKKKFKLLSYKPEPMPKNNFITKEPVTTENNPTVKKTVTGISNAQEARKYLNDRYNITYANLKNIEMIKSEAAKLNISFIDWQ